jgi:quinolinate synthase
VARRLADCRRRDEELAAGRVVNQVSVDDETAHYAKIALERMLTVV